MTLVLVLVGVILFLLLIGVPALMVWLVGLETFRDIVVIAWGGLSVIAFLIFIIWIFALWRGISVLVRDVRLIARDDVQPILATGRQSVENVTGTTQFLGETLVAPIMQLYAIASGIIRAIAVFAGVARRGVR
jgi:hypothetical protein